MKLLVNRIQRCCFHDGPGIRTTVFLQGCPLRCWWCHNPETQASESPEATEYEISDLVSILERDARYWGRSGGGVTISGGEPLYQAAALEDLLASLGELGCHRAVETSGAVRADDVHRIDQFADLWLWDVKAVTPATFLEGAGGDVNLVLGNLAWLLESTQTDVVVRIPLIPGFNLEESELAQIAGWLAEQARSVEVELLPGHSCGTGKPLVGKKRISVDLSQIEEARRVFERRGLRMSRRPTGGFV